MITIIIWLWACICTNPTHTIENHGDCPLVHTTSSFDIGGETGGGPKLPPPPPPPPPGG